MKSIISCFFNLLKYDKFYYNINLILRLEHVTLIIWCCYSVASCCYDNKRTTSKLETIAWQRHRSFEQSDRVHFPGVKCFPQFLHSHRSNTENAFHGTSSRHVTYMSPIKSSYRVRHRWNTVLLHDVILHVWVDAWIHSAGYRQNEWWIQSRFITLGL